MGGAPAAWGAAEAARRTGRKRHTLRRRALVLETRLEQLAEGVVEALYQSVRSRGVDRPPHPSPLGKGG